MNDKADPYALETVDDLSRALRETSQMPRVFVKLFPDDHRLLPVTATDLLIQLDGAAPSDRVNAFIYRGGDIIVG